MCKAGTYKQLAMLVAEQLEMALQLRDLALFVDKSHRRTRRSMLISGEATE
jgi:hypothetical protein